MTSTESSPHTISKQLEEDNEITGRFFKRVFWFFFQGRAQGLVITIGQTGYFTGSS